MTFIILIQNFKNDLEWYKSFVCLLSFNLVRGVILLNSSMLIGSGPTNPTNQPTNLAELFSNISELRYHSILSLLQGTMTQDCLALTVSVYIYVNSILILFTWPTEFVNFWKFDSLLFGREDSEQCWDQCRTLMAFPDSADKIYSKNAV